MSFIYRCFNSVPLLRRAINHEFCIIIVVAQCKFIVVYVKWVLYFVLNNDKLLYMKYTIINPLITFVL